MHSNLLGQQKIRKVLNEPYFFLQERYNQIFIIVRSIEESNATPTR